jgi:hypothetical protein
MLPITTNTLRTTAPTTNPTIHWMRVGLERGKIGLGGERSKIDLEISLEIGLAGERSKISLGGERGKIGLAKAVS